MPKLPIHAALALGALCCLVAGCKQKPEPSEDKVEPETVDETATTGETGLTEPPPGFGCTVDEDNTLRVTCRYEREDTGPISVQWTGPGEPMRELAGDPLQTAVAIPVWDLLSQTTYQWTLLDRGEPVLSGEVTTPPLPWPFQVEAEVRIDGPTSLDRALFALGCSAGAALFVVDEQFRVRWYQPTGTPSVVIGFDWTDRGTAVALVGRARAAEWRPDGTKILEVVRGTDYERVLHHSVVGRQGRLVSLDAEAIAYPNGIEYVIDGVSEITDTGNVRLWSIADALDPQQVQSESDPFYWGTLFPGASDFAHANSVEMWEDDWLVSFKHLGVVVRIDAEDGHVVWWLSGADAPLDLLDGPRLTLGSSQGLDPAFEHQHHANPSPWGTLLMVDNGKAGQNTRVLEFAIDEDLQRADLINAWDLGVTCPVQSSAYGLSDGTVVAACARTRQVFELAPGGVIRKATSLSCTDGSPGLSFVRFQPILSGWP